MLEKDEFFDKIDELKLSTKDYDTAMFLMNNLPTKLFVKILEEIIEGNLFWEDFDQYLSTNQQYNKALTDSFEIQKKLTNDITKLVAFREAVNNNLPRNNKFNFSTQQIGLGYSEDNKTKYNQEANNYSLGMIYSALKIKPEDTLVEREFKSRLFARLLDNSISPQDIIFSADRLVVPIQYEYQVLNESDIEYMKENGLSEESMKKIKSIAEIMMINDNTTTEG